MACYYVSTTDVTPDEPSPGWYYAETEEDGSEKIIGPFHSRVAALDAQSDGAYSEWLGQRGSRSSEQIEQDIIDAGRGHLVRRGR